MTRLTSCAWNRSHSLKIANYFGVTTYPIITQHEFETLFRYIVVLDLILKIEVYLFTYIISGLSPDVYDQPLLAMENNQRQTLAPLAGPSNQSTRSYHAVPPPEGPVWNCQDGIHWKVGSHPRDRYASSRPRNFTRLPSHTANSGSSRTQLGMLSNHLRINAGPSNLPISPLHYPGTIIEYSLEYMGQLRNLVHSTDVLRQNGYILQELSESELDGKKRCNGCGKCKDITAQIMNR